MPNTFIQKLISVGIFSFWGYLSATFITNIVFDSSSRLARFHLTSGGPVIGIGSVLIVHMLIWIFRIIPVVQLFTPKRLEEDHTEPPSDLSPALVAYLIHGRLTGDQIVASVVELAEQGCIDLKEEDTGFSLSISGKQTCDLAPYEEAIIRGLFEEGDVISSSKIVAGLKNNLTQIYAQMNQELVKRGLVIDDPPFFLAPIKYLPLISILSSLGFFMGWLASPQNLTLMFVSGFLWVVNIVITLLPNHLEYRTVEGKELANQWYTYWENRYPDRIPSLSHWLSSKGLRTSATSQKFTLEQGLESANSTLQKGLTSVSEGLVENLNETARILTEASRVDQGRKLSDPHFRYSSGGGSAGFGGTSSSSLGGSKSSVSRSYRPSTSRSSVSRSRSRSSVSRTSPSRSSRSGSKSISSRKK